MMPRISIYPDRTRLSLSWAAVARRRPPYVGEASGSRFCAGPARWMLR